jgi:hypothetical protein
MLALFPLAAPLLEARAGGKDPGDRIPREVRDLQGTYKGSWTMYGIDASGKVVPRMAWTDTMRAAAPEVQGDRAYVLTTDEMVFEGAAIPAMNIKGKEGYFVKEGRLGDYFIEVMGQVHRMVKLADNVWTYTTAASPQDLAPLGFPKGASGQHVLVKVVTREQEVETHRVSRLTTVSWTDAAGKQRWLQFVSLQGIHQRQPGK